MSHEPTEQSFLKDVATHEMTIIRDDGVNRHVQFKRPGTRCYQFDLITWPGYLCYCGDMGTFVFQRLDDMFQFFRTDREHMHLRDGRTLAINHSYWAEKVEAQDKGDGLTEFEEETFNRTIIEILVGWFRNHRGDTTKEDRRDLWDAVMNSAIYPVDWAALTKERAGQKYRPSNGTEGEIFMYAWCCKCARDKSMREGEPLEECDDDELCPIIANTFAFDVEDPEYPKEWTYGADGQPSCTAYVCAGDQIPRPRCEHTIDMFGDAA